MRRTSARYLCATPRPYLSIGHLVLQPCAGRVENNRGAAPPRLVGISASSRFHLGYTSDTGTASLVLGYSVSLSSSSPSGNDRF